MKISVTFSGELRCVKTKTYKTKEGKQGLSYQLGIESNEELGMLRCTQDVVDLYDRGIIAKGDCCNFLAEYDSSYDTFRVYGISSM